MKHFLIILLLALSATTLTNAQNQNSVYKDSIGNVKVTITKKKEVKNANATSTAITVIGIDTTDVDTTEIDADSLNSARTHQGASITIGADDDDFPFTGLGNAIGGGILVSIIAIIAVFGLPVFILFVIFFFRYKNRKARYRLAEQALAAGQPLPEGFIRENKPTDTSSQGIKNIFTGIGLFIFLWAITDSFGIGTIGLLVMFTGIGQWVIGNRQQKSQQEQKAQDKNNENQ